MLYELLNLTRVFDQRTVLDIPELRLEKRLIYAILGPNGSGKTTLLNLLAFLDKPSSGRIRFLGKPVPGNGSALVAMRRKVVLVDQNPILFTSSVFHNLAFGLKLRKVAPGARKKRIEAALEMVGMQDFSRAQGHTLSGGETKRVALARALVLKPEVLLCDEPFANVDQENQEKIWQIIHRLNAEQGIPVILSSHDRPQAEKLAHRALYLKDGRLAAKLPGAKGLKAAALPKLSAAQIQAAEEMILKNLANGRLPCGTARAIAESLGMPLPAVARIADQLKIRISRCQLGCF